MKNRNPGESDRWYHWAAWKGSNGRRAQTLLANPFCVFCAARGRTTEASVADHITPHRGDYDLFWTGELQSLCGPPPKGRNCHSRIKQQVEERGYHNEVDADGYPLDPNHPANKPR